MKKFYLLILVAVLVLSSSLVRAQTYTSILSNPTFLTLDDKNFWQGGVAPPDPCNNCTIIINSDVTMVPDDHTSSDPVDAIGAPALNDVVLNNCTLQIVGGVTLTVNTYVEFFNSTLLVGSDATTASTVVLNDQADLNGTSSVQLANYFCGINTNNTGTAPLFTPHVIVGPHTDIGSPGTNSAGIYGIFSPAVGGYNYSYTLTANGIGKSNHFYGTMYTINCNDGAPTPNTCAVGWVYGPAITANDPTFGFIFGPAATLPVTLVQFIADKNPDESVKLSWATAQEINSASFDVERSADQGTWEKIGSVKAKGYASSTTNYTYTDKFPLAGNSFYRLKMIDLDNKFQYSYVVSVSSEKDNRPLVIYSNPFNDAIRLKVNVDRAQNLTLVVSDLVGKTYIKQSYNVQAGDNPITLVPLGAASGMYILHIAGNTYEQTVKLVKQ